MVNFQVEFRADVVAKLKKSSFVCSRVKRVIRGTIEGNSTRAGKHQMIFERSRFIAILYFDAKDDARNSMNTKDNWCGVFGPRDNGDQRTTSPPGINLRVLLAIFVRPCFIQCCK